MGGEVGEDRQAATRVIVVCGDLLTRHDPVAVLAGVLLVIQPGEGGGVAVDVFVDIVGIGGAVVVADAVFARQAVDLGRPDHFHRQDRTLGAAAVELEAVAGFQQRRILLVGADLDEQLGGQAVLDAQGPLADRPVVPDAFPVADLGAAERQVLEVALEGVEVLALAEATGLDVQTAIEEALGQPQLGQTPGLATAIDFLHRGVAADARIGDAVVGQVAAVTGGDGQLEHRVLPAGDLVHVAPEPEHVLGAPAPGAVVVVTATQVGRALADVFELDVPALVAQVLAHATPVTGHGVAQRLEGGLGVVDATEVATRIGLGRRLGTRGDRQGQQRHQGQCAPRTILVVLLVHY